MSELELRHFRNLGEQELRFPPEGVAVIGDNAQGKTNLLEAIYYLESFRSFRGAGDGELAAFSQDVFHLRASVAGTRDSTVAAGFDRRRKKKKVTVDGAQASRMSDALGHLGAVVFSPADVELVSGGPHERRRFMDILLSLNEEGYVEALQRYRKALAQRNAALKAGERAPSVRAWDEALIADGVRVTCHRLEWVARWSAAYASYHAAISGGDRAALAYRPHILGSGDEGLEEGSASETEANRHRLASAFAERLDRSWESDTRRRVSHVGPHRDELLITHQSGTRSIPTRSFGSGGQRRTAALALRLTEAATIRKRRGVEPIVLLDDAFAELDEGRSERIMALIEEEGTGQVILTAPKETDVRLKAGGLVRWRIRDGVIEA